LKIRYVRSDNGVAAAYDLPEYAEQIDRSSGRPFWNIGAIVEVDRRGAQLLVGNGDCEPADDEAEDACKGWREKRADVLLSREMLAKAIDPEDRQRFRDGEILGYDADGNDIPGPNWSESDGEEQDEDEDE
jgi:hypothetical protein